ncbi:MAG: iron-containing alcohol dehydrogenase [Rikenellaceae bacterium]
MYNFQFQNPTKIIFGRGEIAQLSKQLPKEKKIMVTMGGGSIKTNGVYDQVIKALEGFDYIEFWGIEPNPRVQTLRKAIAICKEQGVEYLLAVGGGSICDGTKLISASVLSDAEPWDIVLGKAQYGECLPYASVITLPATGSEMNKGAVISNDDTDEKYPFYSTYPQFSILDPEATFSLPPYQIACGITDTFIHTLEQYITQTGVSPLMDRWAEGILQTLVETAPKIKANQHDYDAMSNYMLSATMALNGFISMGVAQDWATHMIGHEITALTGLTHGHTLSIIMPGIMSVMREQKSAKILQYGERVWGITEGSDEVRIDATIAATESFFRSLGLKTRLGENGIGEEVAAEVVARMKSRQSAFGEDANVTYDVAERVFALVK